MSNNAVSQQFQCQDRQTVQMENVNSLTSDMHNQVVGHVSHNFPPFHMPISSDLGAAVEPMTTYSGFPSLMVPKNQIMGMGTNLGSVGFGESGFMMPNIGQQSSLLPTKRKAEVEPTNNISFPQQLSVANKRVMQFGTSINLTPGLQSSPLNRKPVHVQSKFSPGTAQNTPSLNKKSMRNEATSGKSGPQRVQTTKSRTVQVEPMSKSRTESIGAVRSKMSEKLAEALSVTSVDPDKSSDAEKNITKTSTSGPGQGDSCQPVSHTGAVGGSEDNFRGPEEAAPSESFPAGKSDHSQGLSAQVSNSRSLHNHVETSTDSDHFTILPQQGVPYSDSFFVKDELLQGNGLSWALDFDMAVAEGKEHSQVGEQQERLSPEDLASQIEVELFKLFGGVNKKYKEKGRSLCFNLKDPNNPELRERVMSGEISPERLCSMTAEELASKELSEWRMAKAEEFAQMVVLPDTDFDMRRRLVKKTHKGEYQVEMEEDSGDLMDVSSGTSLPLQSQTRGKELEANAPSELDNSRNKGKIDNRRNSSENSDHQESLIIPSDGTDLMQGMIVDELKDAEFLPPIISLDEFMESLHSEPPFETLQAADGRSVSEKEKEKEKEEKEKSDVGDSSAVESEASKDAPSDKADQAVKAQKVDVASKSTESPVVQKVPSSGYSPRIRHFWEGTIQLSVSSTISTVSVYKR